jgi:hypothetical protein
VIAIPSNKMVFMVPSRRWWNRKVA